MQSLAIFESFPFAKQSTQQTDTMSVQNTMYSLPLTPNNLRVLCLNTDASFDFYSVYNAMGCIPLTDHNPLAPQISRISTALVLFPNNLM